MMDCSNITMKCVWCVSAVSPSRHNHGHLQTGVGALVFKTAKIRSAHRSLRQMPITVNQWGHHLEPEPNDDIDIIILI